MIASFSRGRAAIALATLAAALVGCGNSDSSDTRLRILLTNDDGVAAEGIDALLRGLLANPDNAIVVSAPLEDASGSGDLRVGDEDIAPCTRGTGMAMRASTASSYDTDVWAVDGCPADAVLFGLDNLYPDRPPHVVIAGLNAGQNVGLVEGVLISQISGTVGAAKTAACAGIPSVASSQGEPAPEGDFDYESGVVAVLTWLEENRSALLAAELELETVASINIPTCNADTEIRSTVDVPLGDQVPEGFTLVGKQDCGSTLDDPQDDLEAFFWGFVAVTPVASNSRGTCDKLE